MIKRISKVVAGAALAITLAACSSVSTQPDEVALAYDGGSLTSSEFSSCVPASHKEWDGPGDAHYVYPKGQRTFSFTGAKGSESKPLSVTTNDSQTLSVPGFVTFTLTSDCKLLREFHERVGKKYEAYDGAEGWASFLNDYIDVPLVAAMNQASLKVGWQTLYTSAEAQADFEAEVKADLPEQVKTALGGDYITINAVQISKPTISEGLAAGLAAKQEALLQNEAQKEKNVLQASKYDSLKTCRTSGLTEQACLIIYLAEQGDIPFYTIPNGGNLNVTP